MINYKKERERLIRMSKSSTRPHLSFSISDAEELLDKAEKWDKVCDEVGIDETHPDAVNAISKLCADAATDIPDGLQKT